MASDSEAVGLDAGKSRLRRRLDGFFADHFVLVFLGPAALVILGLFIYPLLWVAYKSLWFVFAGIDPRFAPIRNYKWVFTSAEFYDSVARTLFYTSGSLLLSFTLGLFVALLINHVRARWLRKAYTTAFISGLAIPASILALLWRGIFSKDAAGLLNMVLLDLGLVESPIAVLLSQQLALPAVTLVDAWVRLPIAVLIFLAGRQSIPPPLYEAAEVDGATTLQMFRHVTLPYLRPYMATVALLVTLFAFQAFPVIWVMTGGGPIEATSTIPLYIYEIGILRLNFGFGSALSVVFAVTTGVVAVAFVTSVLKKSATLRR